MAAFLMGKRRLTRLDGLSPLQWDAAHQLAMGGGFESALEPRCGVFLRAKKVNDYKDFERVITSFWTKIGG